MLQMFDPLCWPDVEVSGMPADLPMERQSQSSLR